MDFYLDENLPHVIAEALDILEKHYKIHRVFSTELIWSKGIKDDSLIVKLKEANGIWITHDLKLKTRVNEFYLMKEEGITVFIISLPSGYDFTVMYRTIIYRWEEIKQICIKNEQPFICRLLIRGQKPVFY
jgi:hypothetical protein